MSEAFQTHAAPFVCGVLLARLMRAQRKRMAEV